MSEITITKTIQITDEDIDEIVASALEGGITYWAVKAMACNETGNKRKEFLGDFASEQISKGGYLKIILEEPFEKDKTGTDIWGYVLSKEKLLNGLTKALEKEEIHIDLDENGTRLDMCMFDSNDADIVIQYALFDKTIFG